MTDFDTIIRGGAIVDGTRYRERFVGDLGIKNGQIAAITPAGGLANRSADAVIDAEGLVVAPGFVDLHTHYCGKVSQSQSMPAFMVASGIASTRSIDSIARSCWSGRVGAKPKPQLPMATEVTPCQLEQLR